MEDLIEDATRNRTGVMSAESFSPLVMRELLRIVLSELLDDLDYEATTKPRQPCPVEALALEAIRIQKLMKPFEGSDQHDPISKKANELLWLQLDTIEERASHMRAKSAIGALFQIYLAMNDAALQVEHDGWSEKKRIEKFERIGRYLDSASRVLKKLVGKSARGLGAEHYGHPDRRPEAFARFWSRKARPVLERKAAA